jgi:phosphoglucomutase/phosphomannomutase
MYFEVFGKPFKLADIEQEKEKIVKLREDLEKSVMQYCYDLLEVDFPDRGFLLFWQLPLNDKLKYFEIEEDITRLKNISDEDERKEKLGELLEFLGANPIQKINRAFEAKYQSGILEYLELP